MTTRLQIRSLDRRSFPVDEPVELALRGPAGRLAEETPVTHICVVRETSVDLVDPRPLRDTGLPPAHQIAGFCGTRTDHGSVEALGLIGRARAREGGPEHAMLFLEWPDDRWWWWRRPLGADPSTQVVWDARLGDPIPDGFGRWWWLYRREGVRVSLTAMGAGTVH